MTDTVRFEVSGPVATVRLTRPDRLNAMTEELIGGVLACLEQATADDAIRAVVLTGAGRGFCAGGDLGAMGEFAGLRTEEASRAELRRLHRTTELLHEMPKVTIAAVNGPCAGAGLSLACAADLRIAAQSAVFATAFLRAGQTGDYGGTWLLPRLVGPGKARELFFLGERIDANEAERIGLVNRVVPDEELLPVARAIAEQAAVAAPLAFASLKANLNDADDLRLEELMREEAVRFTRNRSTRDSAEAVRAFLDKRPPTFEGR